MSLLQEVFLSCLPRSTQGGQGLSWIHLLSPKVPVCRLRAQHTFTEWRMGIIGGRQRPTSWVFCRCFLALGPVLSLPFPWCHHIWLMGCLQIEKITSLFYAIYLVTSASKPFIQHSSQSPDSSPEVLPDCLSPLLPLTALPTIQRGIFQVMLCGIFPDQGWTPSPLQRTCTVWTTGPPGSPLPVIQATTSVPAAWAS